LNEEVTLTTRWLLFDTAELFTATVTTVLSRLTTFVSGDLQRGLFAPERPSARDRNNNNSYKYVTTSQNTRVAFSNLQKNMKFNIFKMVSSTLK
jgi:hypothetical protein